jgi:hypothetical protein
MTPEPIDEDEMNSIAFDDPDFDHTLPAGYQDEQSDEYHVPVRSRRKFLNAKTALLIAVLTAAAGFYGGIRVEKGQVSSSSTSAAGGSLASRFAGLASRLGGAAGAGAGATGAGAAAGGAARSGAAGAGAGAAGDTGLGGFAARFGGGNSTIGTISSVNGSTLYVSTTGGNTVKVQLSSAAKLTKSENVGKNRLHPGDSVVVSGLKKSNGTVVATTVSDSGASAAGAGASGSSSAGSTSGGSSGGVSSLFKSSGG